MTEQYKKDLERNIGKYSWFKIFTKRVYLPLIAIQLVSVGRVTIGQLAVIAGIASLVQLVLQLPTGYLADRWGNRQVIVIGSAIAAVSPLVYALHPTFYGGIAAAILFFGGLSFYSGAIEAFMHDTLVALNKEDSYVKVMGRAQSYGLIGNIVLITAIPATYTINHRLPFFLGFATLAINFFLAISFTYPERAKPSSTKVNPFSAFKHVVNRYNIAVFLFAGALFGVTHRGGEYRELLFQNVGINVAYFGALLAAGSLLGAIYGFFLHALDRLKTLPFFFLDFTYLAICLTFIGITRNPFIVAIGFTLFSAYDRVRLILIQSRLLQQSAVEYKATLLSALSMFSTLGEIIVVGALAKLILSKNYTKGYFWFGVGTWAIGFVLWIGILFSSKQQVPRHTKSY